MCYLCVAFCVSRSVCRVLYCVSCVFCVVLCVTFCVPDVFVIYCVYVVVSSAF